MTRKTWLLLTFVFLIGLLILYWVIHPRQHFHEITTQPLSSAESYETLTEADLMRRFLALETSQKNLDETVWAKELLAEKYEDIFIKLWDDLRARKDRFTVLQQFGFGELVLGSPQTPEQREWNIHVTHFDNPTRRLLPQDWRELVQAYEGQGYAIDQTEWRHPRFQSDDHGASSIVALTMHIKNVERQERVILKANLRIQWQRETDQQSTPRPQTI